MAVNEKRVLRLNSKDNVAIALQNISIGDSISIGDHLINAINAAPAGHKIALSSINKNENIIKYGFPIGHAVMSIQQGEWVHTHNTQTNLSGKLDYHYDPISLPVHSDITRNLPTHFMGYVRESGAVGIRNEIWIINTVGCINKTAEKLAAMANQQFQGEGIDVVYHFSHPYGCSQLGDDLKYTQKLLSSLVKHPNAVGVLVLGLGCENNRISEFMPILGELDNHQVEFLSVQNVIDEFSKGLKILEELVTFARSFKRVPVPVSKLKVGLKCGGSDGFSGCTANPLVGRVSDLLIQNGAMTFLTEVPEMFGAETILMNRADNEAIFEKVVSLVNDFKDYYLRYGQVIYENSSPGNKDGGITTLEEKSLGCIQKGGMSPITNVLPYAELAKRNGRARCSHTVLR
jgi:altronate hydrolase